MRIKGKLTISIRVILKQINLSMSRNKKHLMIKKVTCRKSQVTKTEADWMIGLLQNKTNKTQI